MSPLSTKRNVLAEHLKEVIDTMEQKVGKWIDFSKCTNMELTNKHSMTKKGQSSCLLD